MGLQKRPQTGKIIAPNHHSGVGLGVFARGEAHPGGSACASGRIRGRIDANRGEADVPGKAANDRLQVECPVRDVNQ